MRRQAVSSQCNWLHPWRAHPGQEAQTNTGIRWHCPAGPQQSVQARALGPVDADLGIISYMQHVVPYRAEHDDGRIIFSLVGLPGMEQQTEVMIPMSVGSQIQKVR